MREDNIPLTPEEQAALIKIKEKFAEEGYYIADGLTYEEENAWYSAAISEYNEILTKASQRALNEMAADPVIWANTLNTSLSSLSLAMFEKEMAQGRTMAQCMIDQIENTTSFAGLNLTDETAAQGVQKLKQVIKNTEITPQSAAAWLIVKTDLEYTAAKEYDSNHNEKKLEDIYFSAIEKRVDQFFPNLQIKINEKELAAASMQIYRTPAEFVSPKDKVTRLYFSNRFAPNVALNVLSASVDRKAGVAGQYFPIVSVSLEDLPPEVKISREPTTYDNVVFNAICTLAKAGINIVSGTQIYQTMTGNPAAYATMETLDAIKTSIYRLMSTMITINTNNMGTVYNFKDTTRTGPIVNGTFGQFNVVNQHGTAEPWYLKITDTPILLTYAEELHQVARFPLAALNTPVNNSIDVIKLKAYLLDRISSIGPISNKIQYDTLLNKIGLDDLTQAQKQRKLRQLRKHMHKMLDYWADIHFISSWSENKSGNAYVSVTINMPRKAGRLENGRADAAQLPAHDPPQKVGRTPTKS